MLRTRWLLGVVAFVVIAWAIPAHAGPWHLGLRAGMALADMRGDLPEISKPDMKLGLAAGGFVTRVVGPGVHL